MDKATKTLYKRIKFPVDTVDGQKVLTEEKIAKC